MDIFDDIVFKEKDCKHFFEVFDGTQKIHTSLFYGSIKEARKAARQYVLENGGLDEQEASEETAKAPKAAKTPKTPKAPKA